MYQEVHKQIFIHYSTDKAVLFIIPYFPNPIIHYSLYI